MIQSRSQTKDNIVKFLFYQITTTNSYIGGVFKDYLYKIQRK